MDKLILTSNYVNYVIRFSFLFASVLFGVTASAQLGSEKTNYSGKEFWLTLHRVYEHDLCVFYIAGTNDAHVTFNYTNPQITRNYFLQGGTILRVVLTPTEIDGLGSINQAIETVNNKSLHISSDADIVVQFVNIAGALDDGTLIYPSDNQNFGSDYYLNGPPYQGNLAPTIPPTHGSFSIVSSCDSTVLEITPSGDTRNHQAGIPFVATLNKGDSYIVACGINTFDLSGTKVHVKSASCCNPINIFITYNFSYMSWGGVTSCCGDQLLEQILPTSTWGTAYPVVKFANNRYGLIKIVSASNNNVVSFDGAPIQTLNAGESTFRKITSPVLVTSTAPISITQHMLSQDELNGSIWITNSPGSNSDPSTLWLQSLNDGLREATFTAATNIPRSIGSSAPTLGYPENWVTLITKKDNIHTIVLNGVHIDSMFISFSGISDYMYAYLLLDTTMVYHLLSRDRILAYYYGAYLQGSSAYTIGDLNVSDFVTAPVNHGSDIITICINDSATLFADTADFYLWSNGSTSNSITVKDSGMYYVHMYYTDSCNRGHTKLFQVNSYDYNHNEIRDTLYKCLRESLILTGNAAESYLWSNGDTARQIGITAIGAPYYVFETLQSQCNQTKHYFSVLPKPLPALIMDLGPDTLICKGESLLLSGPGDSTIWSDGSIGKYLTTSQPGTYWAVTTESCFETNVSDTIIVTDTICLQEYCNLVFPTAFTPNQDGRNDIFRAIYYGAFQTYYLNIFNRWGENVYQTKIIEDGWDGNYKGMPAEIGVYYYTCAYTCSLKGDLFIKGEFSLIR